MRNADPKVLELLEEIPAPSAGIYLWEAFVSLSHKRRAGFAGPDPIGDDQIHYWQLVRGISFAAWEISALERIDAVWRDVLIDKPKPKREQPAKPTSRGAKR